VIQQIPIVIHTKSKSAGEKEALLFLNKTFGDFKEVPACDTTLKQRVLLLEEQLKQVDPQFLLEELNQSQKVCEEQAKTIKLLQSAAEKAKSAYFLQLKEMGKQHNKLFASTSAIQVLFQKELVAKELSSK
jgi:hypothetical protein